jgi:hypothetical protein
MISVLGDTTVKYSQCPLAALGQTVHYLDGKLHFKKVFNDLEPS